MEYRRLGATGLEVSVLGLGASALGSMYRPVSDREAREVVAEAFDLGITYFDVSPYYGLTLAEARLGQALASLPRVKLVLSTKAGRYGDQVFDFSRARIARSIDESLARLKTDYLDIVLLHDIEFGDPVQVVEEGWRALVDARQAGKVRYAGASGLPLGVLADFARAAAPDVILSYCHYCLNDQSLDQLADSLTAQQIGLINASPLAMGLLTAGGPPSWHPAPAPLLAAAQEAARVAAAHGVNLADLALQFATRHPRVATTLVSTARVDHLRHDVKTITRPMDDEALTAVLAALAPVKNLSWPSGRADWSLPARSAGGGRATDEG